MSNLQAIADRVEIEALRGEFTDVVMMNDHDRLASLFTPDGTLVCSSRLGLRDGPSSQAPARSVATNVELWLRSD